MVHRSIVVKNAHESDEVTKPIVAIFSWAGGKLRYMNKYSAIFEEQGFTTISLASPILPAYLSTGGFSRKRRSRIVRILLDLTKEHKSRPIMLMSFCQGGAMVMVEIFNYLRENPTNHFNIVGTIFDSGPFNTAENYISASQRALVESLHKPSKVSKWFTHQAAGLFARISWRTDEFTRNFDSNMVSYPSLAPQLFLTSRADRIVDFQDVVDLSERRRQRGVPVCVKIWDSGEHVELLRTHQEEYAQTIKDFISVCLKNDSKEEVVADTANEEVVADATNEEVIVDATNDGQQWVAVLE